jgi:hypothetical protein
MHVNGTGIVATALVALLLLASIGSADDLLSAAGAGLVTKQGVSGQVYVWQAGSC